MDIRRRMLFKKKASSSGGGGSTTGGSYIVNLNGQWEATTAVPNPNSTLYDGVYRSVSNYNVNSGVATMYITIKDCSSFKMYIRSYAESSWDYVMVSQLDQTITGSTAYNNATLVKAHTCGNQQSGTALSSYTLVEFTGISAGTHNITVVYRKDGSVNSGDDRGYILIEKIQEAPETPEEPETGGTTNLVNVGDVAYWNGSSVKTSPVDKWDISLGTAIGVVVIPDGFAPDGKVRIIGLKSMDANGNMVDSNQQFYWSSALINTSLTNYTTVPITDNKSSDSTGSDSSGYLPSDRFSIESYVDPIVGYNSSRDLIPSPYITRDGEFKPNPEYYKELGGGNMLSDFNGLINTQTLVGLGRYYEAANACWNYKDGSSSNIQWYLPAMGELGYLMARFDAINETIALLDGVVVDDNIYYSSSEQSTDGAMYLATSDGNVYSSMKNLLRYVRTFAMVEIDNSINTDNYLTIEALEDGLTASLSVNTCEYCVDGDGNWKTLTTETSTESINSGQTLSFRGELTPITAGANQGIGIFTISKKCNLKGNCMSMLFGDNASNNYSLSGKTYAFCKLFYNCTNIVTVSDNFLPATTLANRCYGHMFSGCTNLTTAPALPATILANYCYSEMFYGCTNLTTAPVLPATILKDYCYDYMFSGCKSLTTAPELPATKLVYCCYRCMFNNCTSLTTSPDLPVTTLAEGCYISMFSGCSKLNYIKMLATDISASDCLNNWVQRVASTGTFVKNPAMTTLPTGVHGIPNGWTVQTATS